MFQPLITALRATLTGKGEPPTPAAHQAEPLRVEQAGVPATATSGADRAPSRDQVALDAYHRWLARGKPVGTDREDWFDAERRLAASA